MKYTVKNEDGQLTFDSLTHLRQMYEQGLVSPEDQVQPEGAATWRRVDAIPELREATAQHVRASPWKWWGVVSALALTGALYALVRVRSFAIAAVLMIPVVIMSQRAFVQTMKRRGPGR